MDKLWRLLGSLWVTDMEEMVFISPSDYSGGLLASSSPEGTSHMILLGMTDLGF